MFSTLDVLSWLFLKLDAKPNLSRPKYFPLIRLDLAYTLFHGFDTLGSHLREEGTLDYVGGLVRLQVQTNFDTTINYHQANFYGVVAGEQVIKVQSSLRL
jgi:hypothetical protein